MGSFQAGMSKADITPGLDCLLYGYPSERHGRRILDRLSVGVVAIAQNGQTVLLISADVCAISATICDEIRATIADKTGVKEENILFAAIHTHSGPITCSTAGWGEADVEYINTILIPQSVKAAREALEDLKSARMGIGVTASYAGINRREVTSDGQVILGQNPEGPYDPTMTVMSFQSLTGEMIGSIIHFATHPTAAGKNLSITRDWPGYMIDRVEAITGAGCIYINGAEGDVGPRLSNGKTTGEEVHAEEIGLIAADDAEKALRSIEQFVVPTMKIKTDNIFLPYIQPPAYETVEREMEAMGDPAKLIEVDITKYAKLQMIKQMYDSGQEFPQGMALRQTVIALDELALVPLPFEVFCNISLLLKEKSPFKSTLLLGLTNGSCGYLPTEDQIPYGGYEVDSFQAAGVVGFPDSMDKLLVGELAGLLDRL